MNKNVQYKSGTSEDVQYKQGRSSVLAQGVLLKNSFK